MKITFVIPDLFVQGAQYATAMMANGFARKGYEVEILLSQYHNDRIAEGKYKPFPVDAAVRLVFLPKHKARENIWALRRYLTTTDAAAVVSMALTCTKALRIASFGLRKCPLIVHVEHAIPGYRIDGSVVPTPRRFGWDWLKRWVYWRGFDRVLTVSARGKDDFCRINAMYPRERVYPVYNPVVDENFEAKKRLSAKHPWLVDKKCFTFVTAGVMEDYKAQIYLLEAVKLLKDEGTRVRLVLFGKGSYRPRFEKFIAENGLEDWIDLPGHTGQLPAEMKAADAFVLPSEMESFGIVIVEALACGLPCVCADAPYGPREILEDGKYGILVPRRDARALAEGMKELVEKGKIVPPDESWKRFTVEKAVERYEKGIGLSIEESIHVGH